MMESKTPLLKNSVPILEFYHNLLHHFGQQNWWPGDTPWEIAVGAVLTQNTNWQNVEKAITNLKHNKILSADDIIAIDKDQLAELIRPSGYYNLKAKRIYHLAIWWRDNYDKRSLLKRDLNKFRSSLLQVNGVGEETADSILLYAFNLQTFVVDAYTRRLLGRHGIINKTSSYGQMKSLFEKVLPERLDIYQEYHALIVALGKSYCQPKPRCNQCPLNWHLKRVQTSADASMPNLVSKI